MASGREATMSNVLPPGDSGCIAIIGMTGRFPRARNLDEFWRNLRSGVESITFLNDCELADSGVAAHTFKDPGYVKAAGLLDEDPGLFDATFFGFTPREAEITDPQHRIFLECAWEALEDAGYDAETYRGSIGVYAGADFNSYLVNLRSHPEILRLVDSFQLAIGNEKDYVPTRVSYKLNLRGPSVSVNTACSTSLVAVHLACQSLLDGECDMALAGAVSIKVPQKRGYQKGGIFSADGHCRAFDAAASGTVAGSGVGVVVLKRLADAVSESDHIYAVIRGSAINNDGSLKVGYTAPSVAGQAEVISEALAMAGVDPETVTYVEAHGTGTPLGDPIEIAALTQAFRTTTQKRNFCAIGSVKTNLGHLDSAAGMAGFIKTVLALKNKLLPPTLHFKKPNPAIDFSNSPFFVNTELSEWKGNGAPLRAGISSFGIGGTNAHIVLEEAPTIESSTVSRPWQLMLLSAKTNTALETATTNLADCFKRHPDLNLADAAFTLQIGRKAFDHRRIVIGRYLPDALNALETLDSKRVFTSNEETKNRSLSLLFPGQGSQYVNMGLELYQSEPVFRGYVDTCSDILKPLLGYDLREVLYPDDETDQSMSSRLNQTALTQPALFIVEYALSRLLMNWGIEPEAMIGHSIGEYVAACLAGVFSLEDGLGLVLARGRLMDQQPAGSMTAVPLSERQLVPLLGNNLSIAAINGPSLCVISGPTDMVERFEARLGEEGLRGQRLNTSHAFHSAMMEPVMKPLAERIKKIELHPPQIPYISNVTGNWISAEEATDPCYWVNHLRQPVRFSQGLRELLKEPDRVLLEVGPGQSLTSFVKQCRSNAAAQPVLSTMRRCNDEQSDVASLLSAVGQLWLSGVNINWTEFYACERPRRVSLPTYPFERARFWVEQQQKSHGERGGPSKKPDIANWFYFPSWTRSVPQQNLQHSRLPHQKVTWLLFVDKCDLGRAIVGRLERQDQDVVTVSVGNDFARLSKSSYTINPLLSDHYDALIKELCSEGRSPNKVVHFWSVTHSDCPLEWKAFKISLSVGFNSILFLARALGEQQVTHAVEMNIISNRMHDVDGTESIHPVKAIVLGPCKVVPQEYTNITCRSIDIASTNSKENYLLDQLIAELTSEFLDPVVAYRGRHRWLQSFVPMRVENGAKHVGRLRKGGIYLIIGGLGNVGLSLAEYLTQLVTAKLVLVGRSFFPPREQWKDYVQRYDDRHGVRAKILKVQALEQAGAEVLIVRADVTDANEMARAINEATKRFGCVHGVIHAAGLVGSKSQVFIQEVDSETCLPHFRAKVGGLFVLQKILHGRPLDFCLLISSLSSILGGLGFSAYAAANLFMDAFAHGKTQTDGVPWISVNYDAWNFDETIQQDSGRRLGLGELALKPEEGNEVFRRVLSLDAATQIIISTGDLQARMDQWINPKSRLTEFRQKDKPLASDHVIHQLSKGDGAPTNDAERILVGMWQNLIGYEKVRIQDNFFELGGDSLLATRLVSQIREAFHVELPLRRVFESPTIAQLANEIELSKQSCGERLPSKSLSIPRQPLPSVR
jgi:acyl transferase domain-containing protein/acyl carrier protein